MCPGDDLRSSVFCGDVKRDQTFEIETTILSARPTETEMLTSRSKSQAKICPQDEVQTFGLETDTDGAFDLPRPNLDSGWIQ